MFNRKDMISIRVQACALLQQPFYVEQIDQSAYKIPKIMNKFGFSGHLRFEGLFAETRNILPKLLHCLNTPFFVLNITWLEADIEIPVEGSCGEHPPRTELMIDCIKCTDSSGMPDCHIESFEHHEFHRAKPALDFCKNTRHK
jgi:hypothetical protein